MNRYMHCDFYPDFRVNFIKKGSVNDVPPVTLKDMGLSDDVDYREQPLEELPKDRQEAIIAEFMFLIDRLLPRNIQDLFYRIALDPRPAYWKAFEQAVCKMQLARYTDHNKNNYGQFIDHVQSGIMDMIADGMSIQDIYDSTCVTKSMLTETADALYMGNYSSQDHDRWQIIPIELVLFGMKDVTYSFNEEMTEFQIKRGNNDSLAIILVSYEDYFDIDCVIDIFDDEDYEKWDASCTMEEYIDNIDATVAEYEDKGIPALIIDPVYYGEWEEQKELRGMLRDAIGSIERTRQFNEDIKKKFTELTENEEEDIEEEQFIREMPFELFEGQIKGMKLISNRLCFGPQPKPKDEIEQHLSLYSDGRVFFSGYVFGNNYEVKYQRSRGKQFKIPALVMTYLLSHVAMYFSKDFPLDLVMDVGDWTMELINTDGKSFKYTGALFSDLELDNVGLSSLIRKYLGMSDLLVFDGDARLPIIKDDDEYIFVNVYFEGGGFRVIPDYDIASAPKDYEALILIGGMTWRERDAQQVKALVEECYQQNRVLGGICDAASFLGTAGVLNNVMHTSNDLDDLKQWAGAAYTGEAKHIARQAVRDRNVITANGTASLEFAKEILLALNVASEKDIFDWYNFHKLGFYTASEPEM